MLKVLVVDDSPEVQARLCEMLAGVAGVELVGCVDSAAQALALIEAQRPDVVVLDIALRDGDRGHTVLRGAARVSPRTQVIVLSNFGWGAMRDGFLEAGAAAYFDKAFEFRKALNWIALRAAERRVDDGAA